MANVNNLTEKILQDAEAKKEEILANAKVEETKILDKRTTEAKSKELEIIEKAKIECVTRKERIISNAELKVRNEKLEAKQVIMGKVFKKAVDDLSAFSQEKLLSYIKTRILSLDITGKERVILNEAGKKIVSKEFIDNINAELIGKGKNGALVISDEVRNFEGGFILEKDGIEINNTFEALVNAMKEQLEYEVAKVLFN